MKKRVLQRITRIVETNDEGEIEVLLACGHRRSITCSSHANARATTLKNAECFVCTRKARKKAA